MSKRIQRRATCSVCGADQAVKGDRIVDHGFNLDFNFRNGTCPGAGISHFGTVEGRDYLAKQVRYNESVLATKENELSKIPVKPVWGFTIKDTKGTGEFAKQYQLEQAIRQVSFFLKHSTPRLDGWVTKDAVEHKIEKKVIKIHLRNTGRERFGNGSPEGICSGRKTWNVTSDKSEVTCPKCLNLLKDGRALLRQALGQNAENIRRQPRP
jgi:hypothetical protein